MPRFVVLGSSNAVPKIDQENSHLYAEDGDTRVLVDCGDNAVVSLQKKGIDPNTITDLILTHFHADHVGSLPNLIMGMWLEKRTLPLKIYGLEYTIDRAKALLGLFSWTNWLAMYPVTFITLPESQSYVLQNGGFRVHSVMVNHLIPTIGLRFEFSNQNSITYSCDTEPCEQLLTLAQGTDVLLQETAGPGKGHTSAQQAGEIAASAKVGHLIFIHYDQRVGIENLIRMAKSEFSGKISAAIDGMELI